MAVTVTVTSRSVTVPAQASGAAASKISKPGKIYDLGIVMGYPCSHCGPLLSGVSEDTVESNGDAPLCMRHGICILYLFWYLQPVY